jgi:glucosylglycerate phosphorylase
VNQLAIEHLLSLLTGLYGSAQAETTLRWLVEWIDHYPAIPAPAQPALDQRDALLITYADQFRQPGLSPLQALNLFSERYLAGSFSGLHILPFFSSTSDDGFAVADFNQVDPQLGSWEDIEQISRRFRLMVDLVANHVSANHAWFQAFLGGDPKYKDYFIQSDPLVDLSKVVRPRVSPLLTPFNTAQEQCWVWTTFSADQIDLNYQNPAVLLEMITVLMKSVQKGASLIRLDAIAYLWKTPGTSCIHLPQTHLVIQILRAVLDELAPHTLLVTETNVPHRENISYFGSGDREAQLVYNFVLPPLVLHTFQSGDARILSEWATGLSLPSPDVTFFNFLASHDGIGLNPARGILSNQQIDSLVTGCLVNGGLVSEKTNPDGSHSIYELNQTFLDALADKNNLKHSERQEAGRFLAAESIQLALRGLPGIYALSLLGSHNDLEGARRSGYNRRINRRKFELAEVETWLDENQGAQTWPGFIYRQTCRLLKARSTSAVFNPYGQQKVLDAGSQAVFALWRASPAGDEQALCLTNTSGEPQTARLVPENLHGNVIYGDLFSGGRIDLTAAANLQLKPYQTAWFVLQK